ncbi:hypothetical protein U14_01304 [Candidatus Moduliflexus flocculans]|uniref:Uncharacterized protein n=1 Tax=Candidatus Moduliflexus flocculans TaxID=1499966 RepID=A0A0S6VYN8_9BACT|nr:hypothetical protein U14_01304 [Candidatus Moduliflexus flocculans]
MDAIYDFTFHASVSMCDISGENKGKLTEKQSRRMGRRGNILQVRMIFHGGAELYISKRPDIEENKKTVIFHGRHEI